MKFSYNWLKELAKFKESPEKLAEFLTLRVFEVESAAKAGDDWVLDIKLIPDRCADASGHWGMAREIAILKVSSIKYQVLSITESKIRKANDLLQVKIQEPDDCPRYTARVIENVSVKSSPKWLRERLETCGIQSINNIVDAANYVMLELGQPTHVFDFNKLTSRGSRKQNSEFRIQNSELKRIVIRRATRDDSILALDDKTYALSPEILVIADEVEPIAIAGIKGGKLSGVSAKTKTIVLESANFDPVRTRLASQLLNLKTDASYRFERGMDPNETSTAIDRLAQLVVELAGGEILSGRIDAYPRQQKQSVILFRGAYANRMIGENLSSKFYEDCWKRLGWEYKKKNSSDFIVHPPTVRRDIQIEEDLIEEVARLLGYENIKSRPPALSIVPAENSSELWWEERIKDVLAGVGFTESKLYEFIGEKELSQYERSVGESLRLENPTSPETEYLTPRALLKYISSAAENLRRFDEVAIFGIAKSFRESPGKKTLVPGVDEHKDLVILLGQKSDSDGGTFYEMKGVCDALFKKIGIGGQKYDDAVSADKRRHNAALFHPYRVAEIIVGNDTVGIIGEIHPAILERIKARARLTAVEIDFGKLWRMADAEKTYNPVGKYPAVIRDIAVVVPDETKTEEVLNVIENTGGKLLIDTELFDYFRDESLKESKEKSLAYHLVFQSPERTLTDEEVKKITDKITRALEEKGWEVRK